MTPPLCHVRAFSLTELLVVIALIALLVGLSLPALARARAASQRIACQSHLRQIGIAIFSYAADNNGVIPYGPKAPPATAYNFYPVTGDVTSLVCLQSGEPVGAGLLLHNYLGQYSRAIFCPGADQPVDAATELAKVGVTQAQSDYYYRHASVAALSGNPPPPDHIRLADLGLNRQGQPIRALACDVDFLCDPSLAPWGVVPRTNHERQFVNVLYCDGRVITLNNTSDPLTVNVGYMPYNSLSKILGVFETADKE